MPCSSGDDVCHPVVGQSGSALPCAKAAPQIDATSKTIPAIEPARRTGRDRMGTTRSNGKRRFSAIAGL
jgi:hypothetical protein